MGADFPNHNSTSMVYGTLHYLTPSPVERTGVAICLAVLDRFRVLGKSMDPYRGLVQPLRFRASCAAPVERYGCIVL